MKTKIVTHNDPFHSDDIFAVATLRLFLGDDADMEVIRTRSEEAVRMADFVVDIGGEYDPEKKRFDHHQEGGAGERSNGVPYASFGLVWRSYGREITGDGEIADAIDEKIVQPVDAEDNGVKVSSNLFPGISPYTIQDMFQAFLPTWKENDVDTDLVFNNCVSIAIKILRREIRLAKDVKEATKIVEKRFNDSKDKRVIVLDKYYPWKSAISNHPEPLFVIYPSLSGEMWHAQSVPKHKDSFRSRSPFPKEWAGKKDSELAEVTGVEDAVFSHDKGFLSVARSKEGAEKLAQTAIEGALIDQL